MRAGTLFVLFTLCLMILSCGASRTGLERQTGPDRRPGSRYIEDFDPLTLRDDDIVVPSPLNTDENPDESESIPYRTPTDADRASAETVSGFRIQLLATRDEAQANEVKRSAIFTFEQRVYLVFEPPYFRLRIGDCRTRKEAEELRDLAAEKGFRDAWIVPSRVFVQPEPEGMD